MLITSIFFLFFWKKFFKILIFIDLLCVSFGVQQSDSDTHTHTHICCCFTCSVVSDSLETPWTIVHQAPLSMRFFRQGYWNRLPFPSPGDFWPRGWTCISCREALSPPVPGQGGYPHLTSSSSPSSPWPHTSALPTAVHLRRRTELPIFFLYEIIAVPGLGWSLSRR